MAKWLWGRSQCSTTIPKIVNERKCTVYTQRTLSTVHRSHMPYDEFKALKNALRGKQGVVWGTENPSYIIHLQKDLILCI